MAQVVVGSVEVVGGKIALRPALKWEKILQGSIGKKILAFYIIFMTFFSIFLEEGGVDVKNAQVLPNGNYNVRDIVLPQKKAQKTLYLFRSPGDLWRRLRA